MGFHNKLSLERKELQEQGFLPEWFSTAGYQLFKSRYQWAPTPREQYEAIAATAAQHTDDYDKWKEKFFNLLWKGWLSPSTPVLSNMGTSRGLPVSCAGSYVHDSIDGFYSARHEAAILTKHGFGTSGYLGDIRPRGARISTGGKASGVMPVLNGFRQDSREVSQGNARRGSFATYVDMSHDDFYEVADHLANDPDDLNIGWNITDEVSKAILIPMAEADERQAELKRRFARSMKTKLVTGKGYYWFVDKANRKLPKYYPLPNKAANLCVEINLPADEHHTFTCVLSSMNVALYDEWKDTDAVFVATVFLDCVASEFITRAKGIHGLEKAVRFTEKARALGLGITGFSTYLQKKRIPFESLEAMYFNDELFKKLDEDSRAASVWMAGEWGVPEWVAAAWDEGRSDIVRNCSRLAVAPTKSTALIMGGISEGINPDPGGVYTQLTAAGEVSRVTPVLLELMKERGVYNKNTVQDITDHFGSVQHVDWLTDHEKEVFKTAFEINQYAVLRLASQRAKYLDQWQSLNLFFAGDADPSYIYGVHKQAVADENILGLYYLVQIAGAKGAKGDECEACS